MLSLTIAAAALILGCIISIWLIFSGSGAKQLKGEACKKDASRQHEAGRTGATGPSSEAGQDSKIKEAQSLIDKMEKENPEFVKKLRDQVSAQAVDRARVDSARNSSPEEVRQAIKHWLD